MDALADFDELHRARRRVPLDLAALGPFVGVVVVIDIGEQQAGLRAMHDQPDVGVDAHRPDIGVLGAIEPVERQPRRRRVHLQIDSGGLHRLLILRGQPRETAGEGVGDAEFHHFVFLPGPSPRVAAMRLAR